MKVSVIVPVYNVEQYLPKCIESILVQDFTDFELLLVDDGSSDSSLEICRMYESRDKRVHVYTQSNSGPSKARNVGIENAQGKYVTFIDSDDYIDSDYLLVLTRYEADLVASGFRLWYADGNRIENKSYSHFLMANKKMRNMNEAIEEGEFRYLLAGPCCKLYRRSLLLQNKVMFDETLTYGEDHIFNLIYLQCITDIVLLPYLGYTYTHYGKQSLTNRVVPYKQMYRYNELSFKERKKLALLVSASKSYIEFIHFKYYLYFWQMIYSIYLGHEEKSKRRTFIRKVLNRKKFNNVKWIIKLPLTYRIQLLLFKFLPLKVADTIISKIFKV